MIKLKDILFENEAPDIFVPRRMDDRAERLVKLYIRNGSKGNLDLSDMDLDELPAILSNVTVGGFFACNHNKLKSLSGAPQHVHGHFNCGENHLESLSGAPQHVHGDFDCRRNDLTSLIGAPQSVGGDFACRNNAVKFTEAQVRAVCNVKGKVFL